MSAYMKGSYFLTIASSLILILTLSHGHAEMLERADIVQVDTGTASISDGHLTLHATVHGVWHEHGRAMALALDKQIGLEGLYGVKAVQTVWTHGNNTSVAAGIYEGMAFHPKVISLSLSGPMFNDLEEVAVRDATMLGALVVAAAGNHHGDTPEYPAHFSRSDDCVVAVGTIRSEKRAPYSNVGDIYLDEVPGESGTSYSTARAAGIAYHYFATHPKASCRQVKQWLVSKYGPARLGIK